MHRGNFAAFVLRPFAPGMRLLAAAALVLCAALVSCEPATFHFVNVYPAESIQFNATTQSPSSANVVIGNIAFGQTHQPLVLASGTLGQAVVTTMTSKKYYCTVPLEVAPSMGPGLTDLATCVGSSVLSCSTIFPAGQYSNAVPTATFIRVLHVRRAHLVSVCTRCSVAGPMAPRMPFTPARVCGLCDQCC